MEIWNVRDFVGFVSTIRMEDNFDNSPFVIVLHVEKFGKSNRVTFPTLVY